MRLLQDAGIWGFAIVGWICITGPATRVEAHTQALPPMPSPLADHARELAERALQTKGLDDAAWLLRANLLPFLSTLDPDDPAVAAWEHQEEGDLKGHQVRAVVRLYAADGPIADHPAALEQAIGEVLRSPIENPMLQLHVSRWMHSLSYDVESAIAGRLLRAQASAFLRRASERADDMGPETPALERARVCDFLVWELPERPDSVGFEREALAQAIERHARGAIAGYEQAGWSVAKAGMMRRLATELLTFRETAEAQREAASLAEGAADIYREAGADFYAGEALAAIASPLRDRDPAAALRLGERAMADFEQAGYAEVAGRPRIRLDDLRRAVEEANEKRPATAPGGEP